MDSKVSDELEKHLEDKYKAENCPKSKPQIEMVPDIRKQKIQQMLDKAGFKLGIAPIDPEHIERVERMLKLKGLFKSEDTSETRKQNTVKSMIKSWTLRNLKMSKEEFDTLEIVCITITDTSDIALINLLN